MAAFDRDGLDCALPSGFERAGETLPPGVVDVKQADIVEASLARDAGKDRSLRNIGKGGSKQEVTIGGRGQLRGGLMVGTPAGPITRSASSSALALALGPTMACTPSTSMRCRATATAVSGLAVVSP